MAFCLFISAIASLFMGACTTKEPDDSTQQPPGNENPLPPSEPEFQGSVSAVSPSNGSVIQTQNDAVNDFVTNYVQYKGNQYQGGDVYYPKDVVLEWESTAESFSVKVSDKADLSSFTRYSTTQKSFSLSHLQINKDYYWQVTAHYGENQVSSQIMKFTTTGTRRMIKIDGVSNTRDLGGIKTTQGFTVKQGMVYRSAKLDDITQTGRAQMSALGIVSDLDLREENTGVSPLNGVKYFNYGSAPYYASTKPWTPAAESDTGLDVSAKQQIFKKVFTVLTDSSNYPIDFHCSIGRDRTGTLAYVLLAVLGVAEKDILCDYELSRMSVAGYSNTASMEDTYTYQLNPLRNYIASFGGATLQENAEKFLTSIGITSGQILTVKKILLQETATVFGSDELPCDLTSTQSAIYTPNNMSLITDGQGVPTGYSGNVLKLSGSSNGGAGVAFDFSDRNIDIAKVNSITFRVYVSPSTTEDSGYPELRVGTGTGKWIMRYYSGGTNANKWIEVSLTSTGGNFFESATMQDLANESGKLGKFALLVRTHADSNLTFYIDSVVVSHS